MLEHYVEKMGTELGPLFQAASSELSWMHWRWKQFRILFGDKPARLDLLNQAAPFFFHTIHESLLELTLLGIARLVGPPKSVGKANLSFQAIPPLCDTKIRDEVNALVDKAKNAGGFAVDWRNRHIAHRDLDLSLGKSTQLETATREKIEDSLLALRNVLNCIEVEYCKADDAVRVTDSLGCRIAAVRNPRRSAPRERSACVLGSWRTSRRRHSPARTHLRLVDYDD
jgi:hypothetical protein